MRLFTVSQSGGYAPMVGGLGYVLAPGNAAYKLNSVAAKDIWVRPPTRAKAETTLTIPSVELPSGTRFISSPVCCPTCSGWAATASARRTWRGFSS